MFARRAPGALLLDYVPPEEPPSTPLGNALRRANVPPETHSWDFVLLADSAPSSGEDSCYRYNRRSNGNAANRRLLGQRIESRPGDHGGGASDNSWPARIGAADMQI